MSCVKTPRTRVTHDDAPAFKSESVTEIVTISTGASTFTKKAVSYPQGSYHKSISDSTCRYSPELDATGTEINPCKGLDSKECAAKLRAGCLDCVTQSKMSYNSVVSVTQNSRLYPVMVDFSWSTGTKLYKEHRGVNWRPAEYYRSSVHLPPLAITALQLSDGMRAITPNVEKLLRGSATNIYETLFELHKLKDLLKLFKRAKSRTEVTSQYLGYHFGYLPLISTIERVLDVLLKLDNIIDTWNDFAASDRIMDFHVDLSSNSDAGSSKQTYPQPGGAYDASVIYYQYEWTTEAKLHLYIKPHIIPGNLRFRVLLKSLGIDKPLAGLWELIPYSWLVDYFVNVDDMIARYETGLNSMFQFTVTSLGYSQRLNLDMELYSTYSVRDGSETPRLKPNTYTETSFTRHPLPITALRDAIIPTSLGWADGPSGKQGTYIVAVASNAVKHRS